LRRWIPSIRRSFECYEALFDPETDDWNQSVHDLYRDQIMGLDVLFMKASNSTRIIEGRESVLKSCGKRLRLSEHHCGLITCKPFPLQYSNWEDEEHIEMRQQPCIEEKRLADFARLARFWTDLGFVRLNDSDFYTYAPELIQQPGLLPTWPPLRLSTEFPRSASSPISIESRLTWFIFWFPALTC